MKMVDNKDKISRRDFIATGLAAATTAISGFPFVQTTRAQSVKPLKIGVIGCGGRGTGAIENAITAAPDIHLVALADPFPDRIETCLKELKGPKRKGGPLPNIEVKEDHIFTGFDCYKKLLETDIDYVILTEPPGFRPRSFEAAVEAGKHIFMEKPVATDPVGVRKILETAKKAKEKGLSVVVGFNFRHNVGTREIVKRIHNGDIGEVVSARSYFNTGTLWHRGENPSWTEMEYQCRNWYYFCWLSGDHIVEQHIHYIDMTNWVLNSYPIRAMGLGGRQVRTESKYGNIYDHFTIDYEYPNNVHVMAMSRQMAKCDNLVGCFAHGTIGYSGVNENEIFGKNVYKYAEKFVDPQVYEHTELIESIRKGEPINEAEFGAYSTLTAIMGRESTYTGKVVTWEEMLNSNLDLFPKKIEPGPAPKTGIPMPGQSRPL